MKTERGKKIPLSEYQAGVARYRNWRAKFVYTYLQNLQKVWKTDKVISKETHLTT